MNHLESALKYVRTIYRDGEITDRDYFDALYILHAACARQTS